MGQAVFITGFNNWGKTRIIKALFNERHNYYFGQTYSLSNVNTNIEFTVETHSNDDYLGIRWIRKVERRIESSPDNRVNLLTALCPSQEENNDFVRLLSNQLFRRYKKLHIFLIENKWEHNAKFMIENIIELGRDIPNVNFIRINRDDGLQLNERLNAKLQHIHAELLNIFQ